MLYTIHWKWQYNGNKLKAWLFQGLHSFSATHADRCIERDKTITNDESNCHFFCTNLMLEVRASCHRLSCGMKPESTTWNPNPSSNQWNDQTTFLRKKKFKSAPSARKIMVVLF